MKRCWFLLLLLGGVAAPSRASLGDYRSTPTPEPLRLAVERRNAAYLAELEGRRLQRRDSIAKFARPGPGDMRAIDAWDEYAADRRAELASRLGGLGPVPELAPMLDFAVAEDGYRVEEVILRTADDRWLTARICLPDGLDRPAPAVICLPQLNSDLKLVARTWGRPFLRAGMVLAVPDLTFDPRQAKWKVLHGASEAGCLVNDVLRLLDYVDSRPETDNRLAIVGRDDAAPLALMAAALDSRLAPVVAAGGVSTIEAWIKAGESVPLLFYVPGFLRDTDLDGVAALIAPRPLLVTRDPGDRAIPEDGFRELERTASAAYKIYASEVSLRLELAAGEAVLASDGGIAPDFLTQWLQPERLRPLRQESFAPGRFRDQVKRLDVGDIKDGRQWEGFRRHLEERFTSMLGQRPAKTPLEPRTIELVDRGPYVREEVRFNVGPDCPAQALLLIPSAGTGPFPAVICLGGSSRNMWDVETRWAWELPARGYVAFVVDVRMSRREEVRYRLGSIVDDNSAFGILAWDLIAAVDYLVSRPEVDRERIGCTGVSVGGSETWILAALDRRIAAAAPVVGLTTYQTLYDNATPMLGYHGDYYWFPGYLKYIADGDAAALIAPRPLLNAGGLQDWNLPTDGMDDIHRRLKPIYELLGAPDRLRRYNWSGGHGFPPPARKVVYEFFDLYLKPESQR